MSGEMDHVRECMIKDLSFYNFDSPNHKKVNASIDARYKGNKARFINHCNDGTENIVSKIKIFSIQYRSYTFRKMEI